MPAGVRVELATAGIDDAFQGLSTDPFGAPVSSGTGLRVPTLSSNANNGQRYLFLLATRTISAPTRVRGIRQYATLGGQITRSTGGEAPVTYYQAIEFPIITPNFYLLDGNISWHLVMEPNTRPIPTMDGRGLGGTVNGPCLMEGNADSPCLVFQTATWSVPQPQFYFNNMLTYAPPPIWEQWQPIASLGNMHDIRFPWLSAQAWQSLDVPVCAQADRRISLYASVYQTAGAMAIDESLDTANFGPEQNFINAWEALAAASITVSNLQFWKVAGAIIFEDE